MPLPDPPVPQDCDLRSLQWIPLDVSHVMDVMRVVHLSADEWQIRLMLIVASWHQVPAASLPDNDVALAMICGKNSAKVRNFCRKTLELSGDFFLASDGRWYHDELAKEALTSWKTKVDTNQRVRKHRELKRVTSPLRNASTGQDITGQDREDKKYTPAGVSKENPQPNVSQPDIVAKDTPEWLTKPKANRGTRLSPDWHPTPDDRRFALDLNLHPREIDQQADQFRDYWIAKTGAQATKLDWEATWRNWIRKANNDRKKPAAKPFLSAAEKRDAELIAGLKATAAGMARYVDNGSARPVHSGPDQSADFDAYGMAYPRK